MFEKMTDQELRAWVLELKEKVSSLHYTDEYNLMAFKQARNELYIRTDEYIDRWEK